MDMKVAKLNIEHFQKLLKTDLDPVKRQTVLELLRAEKATLAQLENRQKQARLRRHS
jgi:hypothetical protein